MQFNIEDGKFFTSSGVSAGIDMTLALIQKLFEAETAHAVAIGAEYTWHQEAGSDPFAKYLNEGMTALSGDQG